MDWEDEVSKIFIVSLLFAWLVRERFSIHVERLQISEARWKQKESI